MALPVTHTTRIPVGLLDNNNKMVKGEKGIGCGLIIMYCDMTLTRRKSAVRKARHRHMLLDNGYLKHISAATNTVGKINALPGDVTRFVAKENNRGINCPTACSIFGPDEVSSVRNVRQPERDRVPSPVWRRGRIPPP
jgi:hypothetical protein